MHAECPWRHFWGSVHSLVVHVSCNYFLFYIIPELSSWQNCKAWYSLFHLPFIPVPPSYAFPLPFLPISFVSLPISFFSVAKRPSSNPAMRFVGRCILLQRISRVRASEEEEPGRQIIFEALWAEETYLLASAPILGYCLLQKK